MIFEKYEQMYYAGESLLEIYGIAILDFSIFAIVLFGTLGLMAFLVSRFGGSQ